MKIITLCLATVFAGLAAGSALAAEGKLNFIGKVVNASCKLEGVSDSGVIGVSMGAIPLSRLKNSQSGTGPAVGIDIRVKDCEKGTYYIVVDGPSPAGTPENRVLALDGSGKPASNVGILLTDRTGTPLSLDGRRLRNLQAERLLLHLGQSPRRSRRRQCDGPIYHYAGIASRSGMKLQGSPHENTAGGSALRSDLSGLRRDHH